MLNSLLLFGGSFGKNKKIARIISLLLIVNLLVVQLGQVSLVFTLYNLAIMVGITYFVRKISNKKVNAVMSVISILMWSVLIDVVSYFIFPLAGNTNILQYVFNGIIFNAKYVFVNTIAYVTIETISYVINKIRVSNVKVNNEVLTTN